MTSVQLKSLLDCAIQKTPLDYSNQKFFFTTKLLLVCRKFFMQKNFILGV